jgi:hypothetical protein
MKIDQIEEGETYMFVATLDPARKNLEGKKFYVATKRLIWRKKHGNPRHHQVWRVFNEDGVGARADELEPL